MSQPPRSIRPPRVLVQDENKLISTRALTQQRRHQGVSYSSVSDEGPKVRNMTLGKSANVRRSILKEVTNKNSHASSSTTSEAQSGSNSAPHHGIPAMKHGVIKKTNPTILPRASVHAPPHTLVPARRYPIRQVRSTQTMAVAAEALTPTLTTGAHKRSSSDAASSSDQDLSSTKVKAGSTTESYSASTSSNEQCALSAGLATLVLSDSAAMSVVQSQGSMNVDAPIETKGSAIAPGAPKAPAATRRRSQVPVATRISQRLFKKQTSEVSGSQQRRSITLERVEDKEQQQGPDTQSVLLLDSHPQRPTGVEAAYPLGSSKSSGVVSPVQIDDDSDPMILPEYQASIFSYERELEIKFLPDPDYMSRQSDLQWQYRVQLIEWLVQVHSRFDMLQETMHLCINYLDRFLSKTIIPVDQLQLAGTVALLLASKYEETQSPAIEDLVYVSGEAYTPARIRQAELEMLGTLNYDLGAPGPMNFLRRISRADHYDVDIRTLAKYLIDVTLCDHRFIGLPSSIIAALSYRASMKLLFRGEWTSKHVSYSGYAEAMLNAGINVLLMVLEQPQVTHSTIFTKYQDRRYMNSSEYVRRLGITQLRALRV